LGFDAEGYTISDLGSRNGTFVGGVRVADKHRLRHGDVISVGRSRLTLRIGSSTDTAEIAGVQRPQPLPLTQESLASAIVSAGLASRESIAGLPKQSLGGLPDARARLYWSIVESRLVSEEALRDLMSRVFSVPIVNLKGANVDEGIVSRFPAALAKSNRIFPVGEENNRLVLAVADPTAREVL